MKQTFTNYTEEELKETIKTCVSEVLQDLLPLFLKPAPPEESILDVHQAARLLNLAVPTVYEKTSKKLIPHFKRDKKLYFKKTELEDWMLRKVEPVEELPESPVRKLPLSARMRKAHE